MRVLDITDFSVLSSGLKPLLASVLEKHLVLPSKLQLSIKDILAPENDRLEDVEVEESKDLSFVTYSYNLAKKYIHPDYKRSEINRHVFRMMDQRRSVIRKKIRQNNKREKRKIAFNKKKHPSSHVNIGRMCKYILFILEQLGVLQIRLICGRDLIFYTEIFGKRAYKRPDAYVTLRLGNEVQKSSWIPHNKNPEWDELFQFSYHVRHTFIALILERL